MVNPLVMNTNKYNRIICADIGHSVGTEIALSSGNLALWLGLDFLFTQTIINVLSTSAWRGVWNIIDIVFSGEGGLFEVTKNNVVMKTYIGKFAGRGLYRQCCYMLCRHLP